MHRAFSYGIATSAIFGLWFGWGAHSAQVGFLTALVIAGLLWLVWITIPNTTTRTAVMVSPFQQGVSAIEVLPPVPRNLPQVYALGPERFEIFSAAIVIALGEGHRFAHHTGQSGDQGVDAKLNNLYGQVVIVQSKLYAPDHTIGSPELRDFLGALSLHQAAYGFFVTTSTFTPAALQVIAHARGRIRTIDGYKLLALLQSREREIRLALHDIESER